MQVNEPVINDAYQVLVPTQIEAGKIRVTERQINSGLLAVADDINFDDIVTLERVRGTSLKAALNEAYSDNLSTTLFNNRAIMDELHDVLQDVALYAKRATYNCHH